MFIIVLVFLFQLARVIWLYYMSKLIELLDTVCLKFKTIVSLLEIFQILKLLAKLIVLFVLLFAGFFRVEEEKQPDHLPTRVPPRLHAYLVLAGCKVRFRR